VKAIPVNDLSTVEAGVGKVSESANRVASANAAAIMTAAQIRANMERIRLLAQGQENLREALEESQKFGDLLEKQLLEGQTENEMLKFHVKNLSADLAIAKQDNAVTKALLDERSVKLQQAYKDITELNGVRDKFIAADAERHALKIENGKQVFWIIALIVGCTVLVGVCIILAVLLAKAKLTSRLPILGL